MRTTNKLTKQGVRDLGGNGRRREKFLFACPHIWERYVTWDCETDRDVSGARCGLCQEIRI